MNNYRDWGIPLGRRFRALKLWFVIRSYGIEGLQKRIRDHIEYGQCVKDQVLSTPGFELMAPVPLNLVCFRIRPEGMTNEQELERINSQLIQALNSSGKILLTQTRLGDKFVIRFVAGQAQASLESVKDGWKIIKEFSEAHL